MRAVLPSFRLRCFRFARMSSSEQKAETSEHVDVNQIRKQNQLKKQQQAAALASTSSTEPDRVYKQKSYHSQKGQVVDSQTPKDFSQPMADAYSPAEVESWWTHLWEKSNLYQPDMTSDADTFTMVIPPPNVTGTLHIGHALTIAVEDTMVRYNLMRGKNICWVPGTDHAGIATQVVVEKQLWKNEQKTRHDLGRDEFLKRVWQWVDVSVCFMFLLPISFSFV